MEKTLLQFYIDVLNHFLNEHPEYDLPDVEFLSGDKLNEYLKDKLNEYFKRNLKVRK